jgi:NTE family protein
MSKIISKRGKNLPKKSNTVLVLQGGGALGAYQAGVFETLCQSDITLDWVVGTSIGAINAAIIAGNTPESRAEKLRGFWNAIATDDGLQIPNLFDFGFSQLFKPWSNASRSLATIMHGVPGFFSPRNSGALGGMVDIDRIVPTAEASFYDTSALEVTLNKFIDFEYLNECHVRLTMCAVNVATAELKCFDSKSDEKITAKHIMASGALPPGFAPVEIEGEFYWDGGIYSNTPLDVVLDEQGKDDTLCFMIDLWDPTEALPNSIGAAITRLKNTQYASRSTERLEDHKKQLQLRRVIKSLGDLVPSAARNRADVKALLSQSELGSVNVVRLVMKALPDDDQFKDIDFSHTTIATRWQAGNADAVRMLKHQAWLKPLAAGVGMAVHELEQLK